jgi:hypothetical protein
MGSSGKHAGPAHVSRPPLICFTLSQLTVVLDVHTLLHPHPQRWEVVVIMPFLSQTRSELLRAVEYGKRDAPRIGGSQGGTLPGSASSSLLTRSIYTHRVHRPGRRPRHHHPRLLCGHLHFTPRPLALGPPARSPTPGQPLPIRILACVTQRPPPMVRKARRYLRTRSPIQADVQERARLDPSVGRRLGSGRS